MQEVFTCCSKKSVALGDFWVFIVCKNTCQVLMSRNNDMYVMYGNQTGISKCQPHFELQVNNYLTERQLNKRVAHKSEGRLCAQTLLCSQLKSVFNQWIVLSSWQRFRPPVHQHHNHIICDSVRIKRHSADPC